MNLVLLKRIPGKFLLRSADYFQGVISMNVVKSSVKSTLTLPSYNGEKKEKEKIIDQCDQ